MRSPDDVAAAAATRYRRGWRDALLTGRSEAAAFALNPPAAAAVISNPSEVDGWLTTWRTWAQQRNLAALRTRVVHTKHGDQPIFTHLDLPDIAAVASVNADTDAHWQHAAHRWVTLGPATTDGSVVRPWLTQIMDLGDADFGLLLAAADWFRRNPHSGLTIRRVPVPGMHTKWLARHRRLLLAILGHAAADPDPAEESGNIEDAELPLHDLDVLGLKPSPREADIVLADPQDRAKVGGLRNLRAPVDELARIPLKPQAVLVVENKEAAMSLPDADGLVIVHSLGNQTDVLRHLPWIPADRAAYWGDIDRHGYTLLSRARSALPRLRSVLMSASDVVRFQHLAVIEELTRYDPPDDTLNAEEVQALTLLATSGGWLRIEQERLPSDAVERVAAVEHGTDG